MSYVDLTAKPRTLYAKLRKAKRSLAWNGKHSWCGKRATEEIAAIEAEIKRRGLELPPAEEFNCGKGKTVVL